MYYDNTGASLEEHLKTFFKSNSQISKKQQEHYLLFGWVFDRLGYSAFYKGSGKLVAATNKYLADPTRDKTFLLKEFKQLKVKNEYVLKQRNTIDSWYKFLTFRPVDNYIMPINRKMVRLRRRELEGEVIELNTKDKERAKELNNLLKQLKVENEINDSVIVCTETVPVMTSLPCRNSQCDNSVVYFQKPLLECAKCLYPQTLWNTKI